MANAKKTDVWMPLYIGDYLADTMHLNAEQHGAYMMLIMHYWKTGPLPDNQDLLRQIAKCPEHSWSNAWAIIQPFFRHESGRWHHVRIDKEKEAAKKRSEAAAEKGRKGAAAKWQKDGQTDGTGMPPAIDQAMAGDSSSQSQSSTNSNPSGDKSPTLWDVWLGIPGVGDEKHARSHLGKLIRDYGETAVAAAVAVVAVKKPAEPNAFLEGQLKANPKTGKRPDWALIPREDEKLWDWAKQHGYSNPGSLDYFQYRRKLQSEVDIRLNQ